MNTYIVRRALIIGLALVSVAWAQQAPDEAARLRRVAEQYLKQYPEADANADGELTREEFTRHAARLQKQQAIASLDARMLQSWHRARVLRGEPWFFLVGDVQDPDLAAAQIAAKLGSIRASGSTLPDRRPVWPTAP